MRRQLHADRALLWLLLIAALGLLLVTAYAKDIDAFGVTR